MLYALLERLEPLGVPAGFLHLPRVAVGPLERQALTAGAVVVGLVFALFAVAARAPALRLDGTAVALGALIAAAVLRKMFR